MSPKAAPPSGLTPRHWSRLKLVVREAALAAGRVLSREARAPMQVSTKEDKSLVTQADQKAERAALKRLRKDFPSFGVLAEESGNLHSLGPEKPEGRFILDPLDGTTNFVHRFPFYCVSLGVEWQGQMVVGCVVHPALRDVYFASRREGATLNGRALRVSLTSELSDSLLTTGFTYRKEAWLHQEMAAFERLSGVARAIRRPGSAALDLAYTARGVFDGFWERRLSPWDVAAGILLVEEAGGKVSGFQGQPFQLDSKELLASNGALHGALLHHLTP